MPARERAPESFWRQDSAHGHTLIYKGEPAAIVNRLDHTAAIGPDRHDPKKLPIPRSREIFSEVENRLGIPAVQDFRPLDRTATEHPRVDAARDASLFSHSVRKPNEPAHYIQLAWQRLAERDMTGSLSPQGKQALPSLRKALTHVADQGGKWDKQATAAFRDGHKALTKLPAAADRLEQLALAECERANTCLHQVRSAAAPAKSPAKDPGKRRDDKGRGRER